MPMQLTSVRTLNGTNYEDWKESLDLYLAVSNLDLALREEEPPALTPESTDAQKASREKWEHSNRICIKVITYTATLWRNPLDKVFLRVIMLRIF